MLSRVIAILIAANSLCSAAAPLGFETHYLNLGPSGEPRAIAANPRDGSIFVVARATVAYGLAVNRVIKTDAKGNTLASFDFSFGARNSLAFGGPLGAAVDLQGNLLVVGGTSPDGFPATFQLVPEISGTAAFVVRIDSNLTRIMSAVLLGGKSGEGYPPYAVGTEAAAVTTDRVGNVYVTGTTNAPDFPISSGAFESRPPRVAWSAFAFVTKLSADLTSIQYSTYFGNDNSLCSGSVCLFRAGQTIGQAIAVNAAGEVTIGGVSDAALANNFTVGPSGSRDTSYLQPFYPFVAKFSPDGKSLEAFSNFGPKLPTFSRHGIVALAFDAQGNTIAVGDTGPGPIPVSPGTPGPSTGYIAKLDPSLNLIFGRPFGSGTVTGVELDSDGNFWITGTSAESSLPGGNPSSQSITPYIGEISGDGSAAMDLVLTPVAGMGMAATTGGSFAVLGSPDCFALSSRSTSAAPFIITSSANNVSSGLVAPAELVSLYGTGIGPLNDISGQVVNGAYTTSLGGYQVLFNGVPAPLFFAGRNQINTIALNQWSGHEIYEGAAQTVTVQIVTPEGVINFPSVFAVPSRPQIFVGSEKSDNHYFALAANEDGTPNSSSNPASLGSAVTIWVTGSSANDAVVTPYGSLELVSDTWSADFPGLYQVKFRLPGSSSFPVVVVAVQKLTAISDYTYIHVKP